MTIYFTWLEVNDANETVLSLFRKSATYLFELLRLAGESPIHTWGAVDIRLSNNTFVGAQVSSQLSALSSQQ